MPVITYTPGETKFDVPAGQYRCAFKGCIEKPPFDGPSKFSKPGQEPQPRYGWQFEVLDGPCKGKIMEQTTGQYPSAKSGLVRLLNMLIPGGLKAGQSVDPDMFKGKVYMIVWGPNPASESGGLHISALMTADSGATPFPTQTTVPPPPPRPGKPAAPGRPSSAFPPGTPEAFWVATSDGAEPVKMTTAELDDYARLHGRDVQCCALGEQTWRDAESFGLGSAIPF